MERWDAVVIGAGDETEYRLLKEFATRQAAHVPVEFWEAADVRRAEPHLDPRHILGGTYCLADSFPTVSHGEL